jgi:molybdenum cofactor synthesis domain-containing protein
MKLVKTQDAVGQVLCHDITQIIKGVTKDAVFRKGHIVTEEDETMLHENDAAEILRQICQGAHMHASAPKEGKIELIADCDGLLMIDLDHLRAVNSLGEMMIATRASGFLVKKGDRLCGTRVIPLVIAKEKMEAARKAAGDKPLLQLLPLKAKKFGVVTTGNEVAKGLIQDTFTPVLQEKLGEFGCEMIAHEILTDDHAQITQAIQRMLEAGCELVLCTGGMSVDPDDQTPLAIKNTGARIVSYGAPVLPGAMFLVSYMPDGRAVCGLPGCVMYSKRTVFDLALPRLLADVEITPEWLAGLGHGGFCLNCKVCHYPNCGFGKGI